MTMRYSDVFGSCHPAVNFLYSGSVVALQPFHVPDNLLKYHILTKVLFCVVQDLTI